VKLKDYRLSKGYTQKDMAKLLGISQQSYSNKELGKREFNIKELIAIEKIIGIGIADIYVNLNKEIESKLNNN
jgi:DNA-binding XRE family transcriptional regulator